MTKELNDNISLTSEEFGIFETFFQYGDLAKAGLVFVGMEEGVGGYNTQEAVNARLDLFHNHRSKDCIGYVNGKNPNDGWFLTNPLILREILKRNQHTNNANKRRSQTMIIQNRFSWLLDSNNSKVNYDNIVDQDFKNYNKLHGINSKTAMIDYYPLPKLKGSSFPYSIPQIKNKEAYYDYHNQFNDNNKRYRLFKRLYDIFTMNISIVYAGIKKGEFKLHELYKELGFTFEEMNTSQVNPRYTGLIKPKQNKSRKFLLGYRTNKNNSKQIAVLTPFLGNGQLSYNDVDVISTWLIDDNDS